MKKMNCKYPVIVTVYTGNGLEYVTSHTYTANYSVSFQQAKIITRHVLKKMCLSGLFLIRVRQANGYVKQSKIIVLK